MQRADPSSLQALHGQTMGTTWRVRLANLLFLPLEPVRVHIEAALALVVQQMSNWKSDSDISRFNQAPEGTWITVPPECFDVLSCALHWAHESGGAWDPTIGPLIHLWGFGPRSRPAVLPQQVPDAALLAQTRARVGYRRITVRPEKRQVMQPGGMQLDLCGIAKGYAVDAVAKALTTLGLEHFLVEIGGELRASGQRPDGQPWRVAIAAPMPNISQRALALRNLSIATSGDQWQAFEVAGQRYSHTLDPRTGWPVAHPFTSVTVLHAECMQADALATLLTVLGPEEGLAFAHARGIAAQWCQRTSAGLTTQTTPAFEEAL